MPRLLVFALVLLAALSLFAAPNPTPTNLDFETGTAGELPPGWVSPTVKMGYTAALATDSPKQGKQCVTVSGTPVVDTGRPSFGNVMQQIDATPYRGKRVRFRGAVRVVGMAASAGLWMRVDRPEKQTGFFENMQQRPIRSAEWAYYEITGDVESDASVLNIGMMLEREGNAFLDDVTLEIVEKAPERAAAARAVTPRGLENLVAFTRLYGVIRHFHPSDEAAKADWDAIAINGAAAVESAKDATELQSRLEEIFLPFAPSVRITKTKTPRTLEQPKDAETIVSWKHNGAGLGTAGPGSIYASERVRDLISQPDPHTADPLKPLDLDLGGGVFASVPISVFADSSHTLPRATRKPVAPVKGEYTGNDRATRIGDVVITWNVMQHFYPYFDVVKVDWPAQLRTALTSAATDRDDAAFLRTLRRLVGSMEDGHGSVSHNALMKRAFLPIDWRLIDDAFVVTAVAPSVTDLQPGDAVVAIDGKPVLDQLRTTEPFVSAATPQWSRYIALNTISAGNTGDAVALTVRNDDGTTRVVTLKREGQRPDEKRPEKIAEVKPGLWYVDLTRINDADFNDALTKLAAAKGIIFDMRGYPRQIQTKPLQHSIDTSVQSARWNIPIVRRPDFKDVEWNTTGRWTLDPQEPRLTKNLAYLTDGRAISYAESWMGIVEAYKLAEIVGEPTAGTNGNVNVIPLPGGYRVAFTGMKVLKHDGSQHHKIGILPTVPVSRTQAGLRAGRDEQLEKAISVLESKVP